MAAKRVKKKKRSEVLGPGFGRVEVPPVTEFQCKTAEPVERVELLSPLPMLVVEVKRGGALLASVSSSGVHVTPEFLKNKAVNRCALLPLTKSMMGLLT